MFFVTFIHCEPDLNVSKLSIGINSYELAARPIRNVQRCKPHTKVPVPLENEFPEQCFLWGIMDPVTSF